MDARWRTAPAWTRASILNVARMAWFSSDRTIREYADDIWNVPVGPIQAPAQDVLTSQFPAYPPPPQAPAPATQPLNHYWYYPYYYFPHSYWPTQGQSWPEPIGAPYRPAPAYMAYPAFREPGWRY